MSMSSKSSPLQAAHEKELFLQALDIEDIKERARFLAEACGSDEELRSRVDSLLRVNDTPDDRLNPDRYETLKEERTALARDLAEDDRVFNELGGSIRYLGEEYELLEELGRGSVGVVFRARQISLNREVAVKIILGSALASPAERERFQVEAEAAATLKNPNIVPIYEINQHAHYDYYSMALIHGGTLGDLIAKGAVDRQKAVQLMRTVARAVQAAHQRGIIHRDLKPANILLDEDGQPHISDFGLACRLEQKSTLTLSGQIMGTPQYMAPEQAESGFGQITTAADVYSLGAILYELLVGVPPFRGETLMQTLQMVRETAPRSPRSHDASISRDLDTIVLKCLEKDPAKRYHSAEALANDLEAWLDHRPIMARPPGSVERGLSWFRRRPAHAALLLTAVLLLLTLGIGGPLWAYREATLRQKTDSALVEAQRAKREAEQHREQAMEAAFLANQRARANQRLAYASSMRLIAMAERFGNKRSLSPQALLISWYPHNNEGEGMHDWEWYYLFAQVHLKDHYFGHAGRINSLDFSPHGESFISSGPKGTTIYNTLNRIMSRRMRDGEEHFFSAWSPDEKAIATLGASGAVKFWNPRTAELIATLPGDEPVLSISWGPSGERLASLDASGRICLWRFGAEPRLLTEQRHQFTELRQIAWSPNGRHFAAIGDSKEVFVWEIDRLEEPPEIYQGHNTTVTALAWQHDGTWLATGSQDSVVRVWGVPGGQRVVNTAPQGGGAISHLVWNPDGQVVLHLAENREDIWRLDLVASEDELVDSFSPPITAIAWSAEAHSVVVGNAQGEAVIWRRGLPEASRVVFEHDQGLLLANWNLDSTSLACSDREGTIIVFDVVTGSEKRRISPSRPFGQASVHAWNPVSLDMAVVSNRHVHFLDPKKKGRQRPFDLGSMKPNGMAWMNHHRRLLLCGSRGEMICLEVKPAKSTQKIPYQQSAAGNRYWQVSSSPDDRFVLATGDRNQVSLWSTDSHQIIFESQTESRHLSERQHAWHPDSTHFATGSNRGVISIWSIAERKKILEFQGHRASVRALAWHPTGRRLASVGKSREIRIWDWENGQVTLTLQGHTGLITDLAWGPNGHRLASVSHDGTLRLWDATAGHLLSTHTSKYTP